MTPEQSQASSSLATERLKVLLVDDEPQVTELLTFALRKEPYIFATASSAQEALDYFRKAPADILVTDIKMPGMDGIELTRIIQEEYPATQTIIITAHGDVDTAVEAMKTGATDFLQKPVSNSDLRMSLRSAAEKWRLKRELRAANRALQQEKELLCTTLYSINEGVITTDREQRVTMINRKGEEMTGWKIEEARGLPLSTILNLSIPDGQQGVRARELLDALTEPPTQNSTFPHAILTSQGSKNQVDISFTVSPLMSAHDTIRGSVVVFRDITMECQEEEKARKAAEEKARLEAQIQRAQKMEAIGMMAGGVAHDLNNILSGILSYPELILLDLPQDSPMRRPLEIIQESGQRAADVVADLLTVARGAAAARIVANINILVKNYLSAPEITRVLATKPGIKLETSLAPDLLHAECSPVHINKCVMNLVINAVEAIEQSGYITVFTENRYVDTPFAGYDTVKQGEYVVLGVKDSGPGIASHDLEHIFEPFYTKKVMGRSGTGLGLAVVWNTVQDHDGYIDVKTGDDGTCFELYLPATREELATENQGGQQGLIRGGGERVLIIDDEPSQRNIASALLRKLGYTPFSVASGEEAVEYVKDNPVDLLLLDMIMEPGINGRETYERIIKIRPDTPAVIASGFSRTDEVKRAIQLGAGPFIRKPYTISQLGNAMATALKQAGAGK